MLLKLNMFVAILSLILYVHFYEVWSMGRRMVMMQFTLAAFMKRLRIEEIFVSIVDNSHEPVVEIPHEYVGQISYESVGGILWAIWTQ